MFSNVVENIRYMLDDSTYYCDSEYESESESINDFEKCEYHPFTEEEELQIVETILYLFHEYVEDNPTAVTHPNFEEDMLSTVHDIFLADNEYYGEKNLEDFEHLLKISQELFHTTIYPSRSYHTYNNDGSFNKDIDKIQKQIEYLSSMEQPAQRTEEWYKFRNGIITASNAYKVFESQSVVNQIIYEKCIPLKTDTNANTNTSVNINTPFHWGQKYEPVSLQIYEHTYKTKVADFGCIQHSKFSYLGASPDGINVDTSNPERFGRMLEIKNIVNREITGIPKKEYWVQMQMQMETCDLDECDFLETKFVEYESEQDFLEDRCETSDQFYKTREGEWKGIILYFSKDGIPYYIYKPLLMEKEEYELWSEKQIEEQEKEGRMWVHAIYWNLKTFSCVFVPRNKIWFDRNKHVFENVWKIIEKERETGEYDSRKPVKRVKASSKKEIVCLDLSF